MYDIASKGAEFPQTIAELQISVLLTAPAGCEYLQSNKIEAIYRLAHQ